MRTIRISSEARRLAVWPYHRPHYFGGNEDAATERLYLRILTLITKKPMTSEQLIAATGTPWFVVKKHLRRWYDAKRIGRFPAPSNGKQGRRPFYYTPPKVKR